MAAHTGLLALLSLVHHVAGQECYYGAGELGPSSLVPCGSGSSACCLLGDTCLSGNACFNQDTGNTYQYGCTDSDYEDSTCPYKCGLDSGRSPWIGLDICMDVEDVSNTWICRASNQSSETLFELPQQSCEELGSDALVALFAPPALAPYVSLPTRSGGSTRFISSSVAYTAPRSRVQANPRATTVSPLSSTTSIDDEITAAASLTPVSEEVATTTKSSSTSADSSSSPTPTYPVQTSQQGGNSATSTGQPSETSSSGGNRGLSTGTKAGVGAGIGIGVGLVAALGAFFYLVRRRKQKRRASAAPQFYLDNSQNDRPEIANYSSPPPREDSELYAASESFRRKR